MPTSRSDTGSASRDPDPLASLIDLIHPRALASKMISGAGSWSVRYDAHEEPGFTVVLEGSCFLTVRGQKRIELRAGDFVFLAPGAGFLMASDPRLKPTLVSPTESDLRHGRKGGAPSMRMLGGYFQLDRTNADLLAKFLPPFVHVRGEEPSAARLRTLVELIGDEARERRTGRELILHRLVEIVLLEALRLHHGTSARAERGLMAGLADHALARSLRQFHAAVSHGWTVASLARAAGMSRAVFAERFTREVGMPPMHYVLEWRIALAKEMLRGDRPPLQEIAERIGYQSASAFSTAFSRHAGCAPSAFARVG